MREEASSKQSYDTPRLRHWADIVERDTFKTTLSRIAEHGWEAWHITPDVVSPGFSYTVGIYDSLAKPEIIVVGLPHETAAGALNTAFDLLRHDVDLTEGRFRDVVGSVEVEFRPIDPKWLHHVMLRTDWYYEEADVPVLQMIYPDMENRFQGEEGFTEYFRQPILAQDAEQSTAEEDFWKSYDSDSSFSRWKFPDPPHTNAYLSETVHKKKETVTYVSHDADDGAWQFLGDKMSDGGGPVLSCLHHPIDDDRSLEELGDLPMGWYAVRDAPDAPWQRFEREPEADESEESAPE